MDAYWILEYGKVFGGYIFLMFIWPTAVFWKHLKGKSKTYHFNFCVTVQIVIVNTIILILGFFSILNQRVVIYLFYGIFLAAVWRIDSIRKLRSILLGDREKYAQQLIKLKTETAEEVRHWCESIRLRIGEYTMLILVVAFGMCYFSYGVFQVHSYLYSDTFVHHAWINGLAEGKIFLNGVYPEAMHCFAYCLNALFGIRTYSILLFLQCVHISVFFISAYGLLREIFQWHYSPIFVLGLYLTMDFSFGYSMSRLQATLPMEFGLYTQFLCALYLIRYLKSNGWIARKGNKIKGHMDENLFLFMMSLSASIAIHYYTTIMALIICLSIIVFSIKKVISSKYFAPLIVSVFCGCVIAVIPMAGALASGIPFEGSINWGINSIEGNREESAEGGILEPTYEDMEVIEKLPVIGEKIAKGIIKVEYLIKATYTKGYLGMYGETRGRRFFEITLIVIGLYFIGRKRGDIHLKKITRGYPPVILSSLLVVLVYAAYAAPDMRLPVLIADYRFCSSGHMLILAVMAMPLDIIFSMAVCFVKKSILQGASFITVMGIYILMNVSGNYHSYLQYMLLRYDSAVEVTNMIIEEFPQDSYTIVSPIEEMYQIAPYGKHEEIYEFLQKCEKGEYSLSSEYVFLFVEKKPIVYYQSFSPSGPSWLGRSTGDKIEATDISKEDAQKELPEPGVKYEKEGRTILESKMYEWCQRFFIRYPSELNIFYEDDNFLCYYFTQELAAPYDLGI